jgi:hypothetical protein
VSLEEDLVALVRRAVREELAAAGVGRQETLRPLYVDVPGAAAMTGLGVSTVWDLVRKGTLPTLDVGVNRTLIAVKDLAELPTSRRR